MAVRHWVTVSGNAGELIVDALQLLPEPLKLALKLSGGGSLDLEHEWGNGEPGNANHGHWRSRVERPEPGAKQVEVLHGFVHVCG